MILGPTSSGKSGLAVKLARRFNGEIISADSRQIYRGLEIGSGKVTNKEMGGIPHHLLGIVSPQKVFTAANFKRLADRKIKEIIVRGRVPIIVGGTGFYIRALVHGFIMPAVKPDEKLRRELKNKTVEELSKILHRLDYRRWKEIDRKNKRRLVRAIEIAKSLGKVPQLKAEPINADFKLIGIKIDKSKLEKLITKRVKDMVKRGFINETAQLVKDGIKRERIRELGFEYQDALEYLEGEIKSKEQLIDSMVRRTIDYVKRQTTWFKRDKDIIWITDRRKAYAVVRDFLAP